MTHLPSRETNVLFKLVNSVLVNIIFCIVTRIPTSDIPLPTEETKRLGKTKPKKERPRPSWDSYEQALRT
jgi:hypothetical protein